MQMANLLWLVSGICEAIVVGLVLVKRIWKPLPLFSHFCAWTLLSDLAVFALLRLLPTAYMSIYMVVSAFDSVLQIAVLVEVAWSALRPYRFMANRLLLSGLTLILVCLGALIWPFTGHQHLLDISANGYLLIKMQQTDAVLRLLVFLIISACGQLLAISWKSREFQIASGFGFCSLISLAVAFLQSHLTSKTSYSAWNDAIVASYILSLGYWIVCFSQNEAIRQPFTPGMRKIMHQLARDARSQREILHPLLQPIHPEAAQNPAGSPLPCPTPAPLAPPHEVEEP
jgi:hypothetical protein